MVEALQKYLQKQPGKKGFSEKKLFCTLFVKFKIVALVGFKVTFDTKRTKHLLLLNRVRVSWYCFCIKWWTMCVLCILYCMLYMRQFSVTGLCFYSVAYIYNLLEYCFRFTLLGMPNICSWQIADSCNHRKTELVLIHPTTKKKTLALCKLQYAILCYTQQDQSFSTCNTWMHVTREDLMLCRL